MSEGEIMYDEIARLRAEVEQLHVQLAGCSLAALGGATGDNDCQQGAYGWSVPFDDVKQLRARAERMRDAIRDALNELGVPGDGYPMPAVNAYVILSEAIAEAAPGRNPLRAAPLRVFRWQTSPFMLPKPIPATARSERHHATIDEPTPGVRQHYWWACSCGDEGGPHDSYNEAWDATVVHERTSTDLVAAINALPHPVRRYIHDLETRCDPAGEVRELFVAREEITALRVTYAELAARATAAEGALRLAAEQLCTAGTCGCFSCVARAALADRGAAPPA